MDLYVRWIPKLFYDMDALSSFHFFTSTAWQWWEICKFLCADFFLHPTMSDECTFVVRPIFSFPTNQRRLAPDIYVGQLVLADASTARFECDELSFPTPGLRILHRWWFVEGWFCYKSPRYSKKPLEHFVSSFASFNFCWLKKSKAFKGLYRHSGSSLWSPSVRPSVNVFRITLEVQKLHSTLNIAFLGWNMSSQIEILLMVQKSGSPAGMVLKPCK